MKTHRYWVLASGALILATAVTAVACQKSSVMVGSKYVKTVPVETGKDATIYVSDLESKQLAGTELRIAAGSLKANTTITLELGYDSMMTKPTEAVGPVAIWGPGGTKFEPPAQMTLPFEPRAGLEAKNLYVEVLENDGSRKTIEYDKLTVVAGRVTFLCSGFSSYQVGARNADPGQDPAGCGQTGAVCPMGTTCVNGVCRANDAPKKLGAACA